MERKFTTGRLLSRLIAFLAFSILHAHSPSTAFAQAATDKDQSSSLMRLSIEELMAINVTSVSRSEQSARTSAAAVTVVTNEEIRRSGANTIPEALRMVPGLYVGRLNSNTWAVSSRGFTNTNSEKLLVQSDTRSVYTPLFSGVFWDVQNYLMEDVERIEVVRGPGASLWGSNAVNGVVSITTKDAKDTQGLYAEIGGGNEELVNTTARYGGQFSDNGYYRVFGRYFEQAATFRSDNSKSDDWRIGHLGFRTDWDVTPRDKVTFQGDGYLGSVGQLQPSIIVIGREGPEGDLDVDVGGGNLLGRWQHRLRSGSELAVRAYYDRTERDDPSFDDTLDTMDLDVQHTIDLTSRQQLIWGANYRYTINNNSGKLLLDLSPDDSEDHLVSAFIQDQIALTDSLQLTVGTKIEHNDFSGFELQPTIRAAWDVSERHVVWGAISRAVRVPTRLERDVNIDLADPASPVLPRLVGNKDFGSEELIAYEIGYRWQALDSLSFDLAAFYNDYDKLASLEFRDPITDPDTGQTIVPVTAENFNEGGARGFEGQVTYSVTPRWRLTGMYTYFDLNIRTGGDDLNRGEFLEGSTPHHQLALRSYLNLPGGFEFDALLRRTSSIRSLPDIPDGTGIDGYGELDLRLGWWIRDNLELSIIGRNLLDDHHVEFGTPTARGEIERSVFGRLAYRY